jgi:hypothetical protein
MIIMFFQGAKHNEYTIKYLGVQASLTKEYDDVAPCAKKKPAFPDIFSLPCRVLSSKKKKLLMLAPFWEYKGTIQAL